MSTLADVVFWPGQHNKLGLLLVPFFSTCGIACTAKTAVHQTPTFAYPGVYVRTMEIFPRIISMQGIRDGISQFDSTAFPLGTGTTAHVLLVCFLPSKRLLGPVCDHGLAFREVS